MIYHQNNRGAFARTRTFLWIGQALLHPRIAITSGAPPAPAAGNFKPVYRPRRRGGRGGR